jgi:hypothetical protein
MAIDKSEPKVGAIAQVAIVSILTLVATHVALVAYFDRASYEEEMRKVGTAPADALNSVRADEKERLASGSMPIDKAMQQLAAKGRMGASADIMPSASRDVAPLQGWTKLPGTVPPAMTAVPAAPPPPGTAASSSSAAASPSGPPASPAPSGAPPRPKPGRGNPTKAP